MPHPEDPNEPPELDRFELVFLRRPAVRPSITEAEEERLQGLHLAHLRAMHDQGHMKVAGPVTEQPDPSLRGLSIYTTGSIERARELAESDPAVRAGRLEVDVMNFFCPRGQL